MVYLCHMATMCLCECGKETRGGSFLPGHDAKYKSALVKRALDDDAEAYTILEQRGWVKFLDKSREAAGKRQDRADGIRSVAATSEEDTAKRDYFGYEQMKVARVILMRIGRYGVSSGERRIPIEKGSATWSILDASHPDLTAAERKLIKGMFEYCSNPEAVTT